MARSAPPYALSRLAAALVCAATLEACGSSPTSPSAVQDAADGGLPVRVELGQGEQAFAPLRDGDALPIVAGAQGGYHVFVSFRSEGLDPERVQVSVRTEVTAHPEHALERTGRIRLSPQVDEDGGVSGTGAYQFVGWPAEISHALCFVGQVVRVRVTLTDRHARSASDERWVVLAAEANALPAQCTP